MSAEFETLKACPGCDKHCPAGQFQCGKGSRIFGQNQEAAPAEREERRYGSHDHNKKGCPNREKCHGHHHKHGGNHDKKWWKEENSSDLDALFGRCAHHLMKHSGRGQGQEKILRILAEEGNMSQRRLQEILDIKPGSLSEVLTKLEEKGLILRQKSESDKRAVILHITQAGKAAAGEGSRRPSASPFACLGDGEQETLRTLLKKLLDARHGE